MKKQILLAIATLAFLNAWAVTNVSAQSVKAAKVNVAFDFQAKGKTFSAGEYYIESISRNNDNLLSIKSSRTGKNQLIITNQLYAGKIQSQKLIFERRGEKYFLTGIFLENGLWGFSLPAPRLKSERNMAAVKPETVELPLLK